METERMIEDTIPPQVTSITCVDSGVRPMPSSAAYAAERDACLNYFTRWNETDQVEFVEQLLARMCHYQHGHINAYLKPMLQRDFISMLPKKGLDHVAENILSYLDASSLCAAELVCREWLRVISEGMLWKKLIERKVRTDSLWRGLAERRGWIQYLFKPKPGSQHPSHSFYRQLYPKIIKDIQSIEDNWRMGKHNLQRINCRSENSKGVYCLQYDDNKIVSGLRDNTIKIWDRKTLQCVRELQGHTGSVLCLQYDERAIISGSSDSTVRVWDVNTGAMLNTLIHHCEAVLHLRFCNGMMVTCSKDGKVDIKILDLQTLQRGSPVTDLLYFIFTGSDEQFRAKYFDRLVEHYYSQLSASMRRLHLNPHEIFSKEDFDAELKEKLPFGLTLATFSLPVITVDTEDAPKVDETLEISSFSTGKTNDLYSERLNGVVNDYVRWGILK